MNKLQMVGWLVLVALLFPAGVQAQGKLSRVRESVRRSKPKPKPATKIRKEDSDQDEERKQKQEKKRGNKKSPRRQPSTRRSVSYTHLTLPTTPYV